MTDNQTADPTLPKDPKAAREQAADYLGFLAGVPFNLGDGETWELPNPAFMDPEQSKRYRDYQREIKTLDTETVDHPLIEGKTVERTIYPYLKGGEDYDADEHLCIALMGEDIYAKFLKAGGVPGQIDTHWKVMQRQLEERIKNDSKSN